MNPLSLKYAPNVRFSEDEGNFNVSTNSLPQSSIGQSKYPLRAYLVSGEDDSEPLSVFEMDEHEDEDDYYKIKRPTQSNLPPSKVCFGSGVVTAGKFCSVGINGIRWVAFDDEDGTPEEGDYVGTKEDEYKLFMYKFGFQVLEYNASDGLVLVRPCPLIPHLVKAVSGESGGEIDVQFADYEGNVYRDAFTVKTLPE